MRAYRFNINCADRLKIIFLVLLTAFTLNGMGQTRDKIPDSINVSEEVPPAAMGDSSTGEKDSTGVSSDSQSVNYAVSDSILLRTVPDSNLSMYKKDKDFAYANDPAYWKHDSLTLKDVQISPDTSESWGLSFRTLIFILVAGLLFALLYRLYFYQDSVKTAGLPGQEDEDETEEGFDDRIREALHAKDYRMGIRYLFLKTLRMLDKRKLIRYQAKVTNREYVLQMSGHKAGAGFQFLANAYDHVWYGDFLLTDQQFDRLHEYFNEFFSSLSNER